MTTPLPKELIKQILLDLASISARMDVTEPLTELLRNIGDAELVEKVAHSPVKRLNGLKLEFIYVEHVDGTISPIITEVRGQGTVDTGDVPKTLAAASRHIIERTTGLKTTVGRETQSPSDKKGE